jgi:hypothetical protein
MTLMGFHTLQAAEYAALADRAAREFTQPASPSRRRYLRRQIDKLRAREAWHRARIGRPVPAAAARHASLARHWLQVARTARSRADYAAAMGSYRAALRAAGEALKMETAARAAE